VPLNLRTGNVSPRRIAILGSTGSIGRQSLKVASSQAGLSVCALGAGSNWQLLAEQAHEFRPDVVAIAEEKDSSRLKAALPGGIELLCGPEAMTELVLGSRPDMLLTGLVGSAGLKPTLAAIECGSSLAIANKETLVMAGAIIMPLARRKNLAVLPVDSEHSAIFQCLSAGKADEVRRVVITASGGALREHDEEQADRATVADALAHPTWRMGRKITIDSSTLVNKALEVVEAHWLFGLPPEKIEVVLHAESIVHSFVEFCDGSVIAQMSRPDMALPIAYALCWPARANLPAEPLDLPAVGRLTFKKPAGRFARAIQLGYQAIRAGGLAGAVLNSANEAAVQAFLDGKISFGRIVPMVEGILNKTPPCGETTLEAVLQADAWARQQVERTIADKGR